MNSWVAALLIAISGLLLFSQFGRRLSAKHSLVWMAVFGFLIVAALSPELLVPIALALGFKLVSNFVLAGLIFFSFLEIIQQSAQNVKTQRKLREVISAAAAERFLTKVLLPQLSDTLATNRSVLVVTPCFNEEASLPATIRALELLRTEHPEVNYCIVNDGSTDASLKLLRKHSPENHTSHFSNAGVGAALLTGFYAARELGVDYVVQCDADGQHPIQEIPRLVAEARQTNADLLIGSRFVRRISSSIDTYDSAHRLTLESTTLTRWAGGRTISLVLGLFGSQARIKDPTSGFRVYSHKAFNSLIEHMPEEYPEPESIAILLQKGMSVRETRVKMHPRQAGVSSLSGLKSAQFMIKVSTALLALRLRRSTVK